MVAAARQEPNLKILLSVAGTPVSAAGTATISPITVTGLLGGRAGGAPFQRTYTPCVPASAVTSSITISTSTIGTAAKVEVSWFMARFDIQEIDPTDPGNAAWITTSMQDDLPESGLCTLLTRTASPGTPTVYLIAKEAEQVIGFVAYMAHDLIIGAKRAIAYQACSVVTARAHRGKGIFSAIAREAESLLRQKGAAFIFGFPNPVAYPLWVHKLGYTALRTQKWRGPTLPGFRGLLTRTSSCVAENTVQQNDHELIEVKRRLYGNRVIVTEDGHNVVWGVRRQVRRLGIAIPVLDIGGLRFQNERQLMKLYREALMKAGVTVVARFDSVVGNPATRNFIGVIMDPQVDRSMIVRHLTPLAGQASFSFFGGIRDTF
jgi:predicted N-acetyltransferase YhbS